MLNVFPIFSFLTSLTKVSKPWQVIDEHGDVIENDEDDVSSIGKSQ